MRNCLTSLQSSIAGTVFFVILVFPQRAVAASQNNPFSPPSFFTIQAQEAVEYFFAFKIENKVAVLEKQAEKRLVSAQEYALQGNDKKTQNSLQNYLKIKERQTQLLGKLDDENDLKTVTDSTIEQQKVLETIKTKTNSDTKQEVIQVQEKVVNQMAKQVIDVHGSEKATEFLNDAAHVWAPGTGPGDGEAEVVYEGGGKLLYAPGTGPGGTSGVVIEGGMKFATGASMDSPGADVKTIEIKTGGVVNDPVPVPEGSNYAPGTTGDSPAGSAVNIIDPGGVDLGGVDPGTSTNGDTWLAP